MFMRLSREEDRLVEAREVIAGECGRLGVDNKAVGSSELTLGLEGLETPKHCRKKKQQLDPHNGVATTA